MTSTVTTIEAFYFWYGFVASAGRSAFFLSTTMLITRWFDRRRGLVMGIMMAGNGLGPFIFSPLVTWMIFMWDWQTAYLILSINMMIFLCLSCLFIRNYPHDMGLLPYGAQPAPAVISAASVTPVQTSRRAAQKGSSPWREVLRMESFWTVSVINFFCCLCHSIPLVHVVSFAQSADLSPFASAWVLAIMSISSIAGRIYWGLFADRHGARLALMLTLFLQGALILWLVNTQDPVVFFLYALLWGFGYGGVGTQYGIVSRELYGARLFGQGYAGQNSFAMVGMALGGYLGGYIYDLSGSYVMAWLLSFASGLISSLLAMDLLAQMDRAKAASVQTKSDSPQPEQAASV
jgi:MFS family permease